MTYHPGMSGTAPLLLVSMPQMQDPRFAKAVILLCDYTDQGAFGLVVNRRMDDPAWTVVKTDPPIRVDPDVRLWVGGPVEPTRTWILMADAQGPDDEQREICPGVVLSVSRTLILDLLQSQPSTRARLIAGYAGWGPGQLDRELAASGWLTAPVDADLIFRVPADRMWETAIRRLGADPAALQTSGGVH